jgi:hypothetical protein
VPNARAFALAAVCVAPLAALDVLRRLGFHAGGQGVTEPASNRNGGTE